MGSENLFLDILVSALITVGVILPPYIIIKIIPKIKISIKQAKIITIICSIISYLIFLAIFFLVVHKPPSIPPIILWNFIGYLIIKSKCTDVQTNKEKSDAKIEENSIEKIIENETANHNEIKEQNKVDIEIKHREKEKNKFNSNIVVIIVLSVVIVILASCLTFVVSNKDNSTNESTMHHSTTTTKRSTTTTQNNDSIDYDVILEKARQMDEKRYQEELEGPRPDLDAEWH